MLRLIFKIIDIAVKECAPWQIAGGVTLGVCLGMGVPLTLQWLLVLAFALIFRFHFPSVLGAWILCLLPGQWLRPFFHLMGEVLLRYTPFLHPLWSDLYHAPIAPYTWFNNTVVLGSTLFLVILAPFLFLGARAVIT